MKVKNYSQALNFLYQQVPRGVKRKFPGALGLARTKAFLKLLKILKIQPLALFRLCLTETILR